MRKQKGLLDVAHAVQTGHLKMEDVPEGIRMQVGRLCAVGDLRAYVGKGEMSAKEWMTPARYGEVVEL